MAIVRAFRGILYNPKKVNCSDVMSPPYDIISDELKRILYEKSPYNIVRIDCGENSPNLNKYELARKYLSKWLSEDVLIQDETENLYGYEIDYSYKNKKNVLRGLVCIVKLEELGKGIYPHEQTYSKPKVDRLSLMKYCMANTSLIFSLYRSKERITSKILEELKEPFIVATDLDSNIHKLYKISDKKIIDEIVRELKDKPIFIADGHHRYEVALEFREKMNILYPNCKDAPWNYVLMFLTNIEDNGYLILPTHRLLITPLRVEEEIKKNQDMFSLIEFNGSDIEESLENRGPKHIGLYLKENKWFILYYKGKPPKHLPDELGKLDVILVEEIILKLFPKKEVCYETDIEKSIKFVKEGKCDAVFILRSTKVEEIERVALKGLRMPPKSTYFYPKLLTGMIINSFNKT
ncbi:MAG: DUF1015 domain-containing protein [Thermodesulfovibrionaceae bacterium]